MIRVIQWGTGTTGAWSVRHIAERPDLELVGCRVYSETKDGIDAGLLCGTGELGLLATRDNARILATDADVVLYMASAESAFEQCLGDVVALLGSGKNVVATGTPFQDVRGLDPQLGEYLGSAARQGRSTFLGLGIFPGYMESTLPFVLGRLSRSISRLEIRETLLNDEYPSHELMFDLLGYGADPADTKPAMTDVSNVAGLWAGSVAVLRDGFGLDIDEVRPFREVALAERDFEVAAGHIANGTVAAMRMGVEIVVAGQAWGVIEHCSRMAADVAPHWPTGDGYEIVVDGEPSLRCHVEFARLPGSDPSDQACIATAAHAVNTIDAVIAAEPGIESLATVHHLPVHPAVAVSPASVS